MPRKQPARKRVANKATLKPESKGFELNEISFDPAYDKEGKEFVFLDDKYQETKGSIFVARAGNPRFEDYLLNRFIKWSDENNRFPDSEKKESYATIIPKEEQEVMELEATAETILLGWKGLLVEGQEVPYSVKNAKTLLQALPFLRRQVQARAMNYNEFKKSLLESLEKN